MSIEIIKPEVFKHVASEMMFAAFRQGNCCSGLTDDLISAYINSWAFLNYKSYMTYWTNPEILALAKQSEVIQASLILVKVPPIQLLRWLHGIRNHISIPHIKAANFELSGYNENTYLFLNKMITQLQAAIFSGMEEYRKACENDVPPLESAV